jgi:hypothetical protein
MSVEQLDNELSIILRLITDLVIVFDDLRDLFSVPQDKDAVGTFQFPGVSS